MSARARQYKTAIYGQLALVGKALSNPQRIEILDLLLQAERSVEVLALEAGMPLANASHHLQVLKHARLVETERRGRFVVYRIADPSVLEVMRGVRAFGERCLAEIEHLMQEFIADEGAMEAVDADDLLRRLQSEECFVIDVRPTQEYEAGHLAGAVSMPLRDMEARLSELPRDREIVAYCRSPYCVVSVEAVKALRQRGFDAVCVRAGVLEMAALRMTLVSGPAAQSAAPASRVGR